MMAAQTRIHGVCRVAPRWSTLPPARPRTVWPRGGKRLASLRGVLGSEGPTEPHTTGEATTIRPHEEEEAFWEKEEEEEEEEEDKEELEAYLENFYYSRRKEKRAHQQVPVQELAAAVEQLEPGLRIAPELRGRYWPGGHMWLEMDAVVVGPTRVYLAWHEYFVRNSRHACRLVMHIACHISLIQARIRVDDPSVAAFKGKEVIAVFMAEKCASPEVDAGVQEMCRHEGILRYVRNGATVEPLP